MGHKGSGNGSGGRVFIGIFALGGGGVGEGSLAMTSDLGVVDSCNVTVLVVRVFIGGGVVLVDSCNVTGGLVFIGGRVGLGFCGVCTFGTLALGGGGVSGGGVVLVALGGGGGSGGVGLVALGFGGVVLVDSCNLCTIGS